MSGGGVFVRKKILALILAAVMAFGMAATVSAAGRGNGPGAGNAFGICINNGNCIALCPMTDDDGNFLAREAFTANLDKAINDGLIKKGSRDFFI